MIFKEMSQESGSDVGDVDFYEACPLGVLSDKIRQHLPLLIILQNKDENSNDNGPRWLCPLL